MYLIHNIYLISHAVYNQLCVIFLKGKNNAATFFIFGLHTDSAWTHLGLLYTDSVCGLIIPNRGRNDTTLILLVNRVFVYTYIYT